MQGFTTVPFKTESAHGLKTVNGIAKFSAAGIVLEFEAKLFGLIGDGLKEVRIAKDEIFDIKFRKGLFKAGAKIVIRTTTLAKLAELPNQDGKLILKLVRDDFERGQSAVQQLQREINSQRDQLAAPPPSPVHELFTDDNEEETNQLTRGED